MSHHLSSKFYGSLSVFNSSKFEVNILVNDTYLFSDYAFISFDIFYPILPMKTKPSLYSNFSIYFEPMCLNHNLHLFDKLEVQSSLQAAATIYPWGMSSLRNYSKFSEVLYVSNTWDSSVL